MSAPHFPAASTPIYRAVVPAAGLGTRLRPLTNTMPKEMLPIGRKPVLAHVAAELRGAGITEILFIVSERKPQIEEYFGDIYSESDGDKTFPPVRCYYINQKRQHGLGDALLYAEEWADEEPFVVAFGDCMMDAPDPSEPVRRLIAAHRELNSDATVIVETVPLAKVSRYGVLAPME